MSGAVLVSDLRRSFGTTRAVDGASWAAEAGTVTAVLGPNGAGKTTTVECLEGLQRPDGGARAGARHRPVARRAGPPGPGRRHAPGRRAAHDEPAGAAPAPPRRAVRRAGARSTSSSPASGIDAFAGTTVRRMSGGQRQRVALAARAPPPPRRAVPRRADRRAWTRTPGSTCGTSCAPRPTAAPASSLTTHSFEEAERVADRVVIMAAGRVVADGTLAGGAGRAHPGGRLLLPHDRGRPVSTAAPAARGCSPRPGSRRAPCSPTASSCSSRSCSPPWPSSGSRWRRCPTSARARASTWRWPGRSRWPWCPPRSPARPSRRGSTGGPGCCACSAPRPWGAAGCSPGKALAVLSVLAVQVVVLGGAGRGPRRAARGMPASCPRCVSLLLGSATFVALALLLAGTLRAEAVLALANLVWVLLLGLGTLVPTDRLPGRPRATSRRSCPRVRSATRCAPRSSTVAGRGAPWAVLVGWGVVGRALASRLFRWSG